MPWIAGTTWPACVLFSRISQAMAHNQFITEYNTNLKNMNSKVVNYLHRDCLSNWNADWCVVIRLRYCLAWFVSWIYKPATCFVLQNLKFGSHGKICYLDEYTFHILLIDTPITEWLVHTWSWRVEISSSDAWVNVKTLLSHRPLEYMTVSLKV